MSDFKSKLPDFKELAAMSGKLYKGLKSSIEEIIHDYKEKRADAETETVEPAKKPKAKAEDKDA